MLLSGVLFVLFLAGCWLYCLTDAALTPAQAFPGWRKRTWIAVIALTLLAGAIAWMIARRNWRSPQWSAADATNLMIIDRSGGNVLWYPFAPAEAGDPAETGDSAETRDPAEQAEWGQAADWGQPLEWGQSTEWGQPTAGAADEVLSRHPAGRSRGGGRGRDRARSGWTVPRGPDDDPEFIRQLAQRIHGTPTDPAE